MPKWIPCKSCHGTGRDAFGDPCNECDGIGRTLHPDEAADEDEDLLDLPRSTTWPRKH